MNWAVPPWELAGLPECWGQWAIDYQTAVRDSSVMRKQIDEAREKGQSLT